MDESILKEEARLYALEYMVTSLYAKFYQLIGCSEAQILEAHKKGREMLSHETFPGGDAAESDLLAQEVQAAVEKLLSAIEEQMGISEKR